MQLSLHSEMSGETHGIDLCKYEKKMLALMIIPTLVFLIFQTCIIVFYVSHPAILVGTIITIAFNIVAIPLCAFWIWQFYVYRHAQFIAARGYETNIRLAVISLFMLAVERPILALFTALWQDTNGKSDNLWQYLNVLWGLSGSVFLGAWAYLVCWKVILIWHEYRQMESCQNDQWQHFLVKPILDSEELSSTMREDSREDSASQFGGSAAIKAPNKVLDSARTWGNRWWVFKRLAIIYCVHMFIRVASVFAAVAGYISWQIDTFLETLMFFGVFVVLLVCWCRTPKFYDMFNVRREMQILVWVPLIRMVFNLGITMIEGGMIGWIVAWNIKFNYAIIGVYVPVCLALTWYPVKKGLEKGFIDTKSAQTPFSRQESLSTSNVMTPRKHSSHQAGGGGKRVGLRGVLGNKKTVALFAYHLVEEFSVECILAVIEFGQFKLKMHSDKDFMGCVTTADFEDLGAAIPQLPLKKLPKSRIVHSRLPLAYSQFCKDDPFKEYKVRAWLLFARYIDPSTAELEINISYRMRRQMLGKMSEIEGWMGEETSHNDLWNLFTGSTKVMLGLMGDAFGRFLGTEGYRKCEKHLNTINTTTDDLPRTPRSDPAAPHVKALFGAISKDSHVIGSTPVIGAANSNETPIGITLVPGVTPDSPVVNDVDDKPKGFFQTIDFDAIDDDD